MSAKDIYHDVVKHALENDGWKITDDPLHIKYGTLHLYVDLGAENLVAAEKEGSKIAVEIKSFIQLSPLNEFHSTVGQYINYRTALNEKQPERILYLAIPEDIYKSFFILPFVQKVLKENHIKYFTYETNKESILQWQT